MYKYYKGGSFKVFSDEDIKAVHEATIYLLENVGIKIHNDNARRIFAENGANVNEESRIVKIPRSMVEEAVDSTPSRLVLCGREEKNDLLLEGANKTIFCWKGPMYTWVPGGPF